MMQKILIFIITLVFLNNVNAQVNLPDNLSNYTSASVSDAQIQQIAKGLKDQNISISEFKAQILKRKMLPTEADLIVSRVETALTQVGKTNIAGSSREPEMNPSSARYVRDTAKTLAVINPKKIFGLEIFNNGVLTFEPNLRIATPKNYIVGPDDELTVNIYGYQEANYKLSVSPDGDVVIPLIGSIYVSGLTIEQASKKIKDKLAANGYSNIRTGLTKVNLSITKIRSIRVSVIGEVVKPGTYTLPSLATAFNALYLSGGPTEIGSMRNIEILRGGKIIDRLDIYDFLLNEGQVSNIQLRDQDIIRIPAYNVRVSVEGQTKRTGLFETKKGETFQDVLRFAGGFTDSAYQASVQSNVLTDTTRRIVDITKENFSKYKILSSQSFTVRKLADRFSNRVSITGEVYFPGNYELVPNMTLRDLVMQSVPSDSAYYGRAILIRMKEDFTKEFISFNLLSVINKDTADIYLKREDEISISKRTLLRSNYGVTINGEVRAPGEYPYAKNITLKDLIFLAQGFTDAAVPQRIEIGRRIINNFDTVTFKIAQVINISSVTDIDGKEGDVELMPWDVVTVRRNPGYKLQVNVSIDGEVVYPGPYVMESSKDRISDLIKRAGGLTPQAYSQGVYLTRVNKVSVKSELDKNKVFKIASNKADSTTLIEDLSSTTDQIAINLDYILKNPDIKENLILEEGDILTVLKEKREVRVSGEVLFPTQIVQDDKYDLKDYISKAGGFTDAARKGRIYVLYPNGSASKTRSFLFFRSYPKVMPGSEIIVPEKIKENRNKLSVGELIGLTAALASVATVVIAATNAR